MGTKPVTRDDGKTVTGHVWVKEETERANEEPMTLDEVLKLRPPISLDQRALTKGALMLATGLSAEDAETWMGNGEKWPATPAELESFARMFFDRCLEVMRAKNARYAGEEDPFRNLRRGGVFGIAVRMDDKVSRMLTLSHPLNKLDGLDESIEDTAVDMANYAMLMLALKTNLGGK